MGADRAADPAAPPAGRRRLVAAVLNLVVPGLGQVFVGQTLRGVAWLLLAPLLIAAFIAFESEPSLARLLSVISGAVMVAFTGALIDVLLIPAKKHRAATIAPAIFAGVAILSVPILAVAARKFVIEAFKVPSGAMIPTIAVGDHFFADKVVYRGRAPRRGEVIVFQFPERPEQDFVKRAIAVDGDRLEVRDGHPIINGWEVPSCRVGIYRYVDAFDPSATHEGELFVEFLEASSYFVLVDASAVVAHDQGPFVAGRGETWVLGDNRNNSHDSRMWFGGMGGGVPAALVLGRARTVWMSDDPTHRGSDLAGAPAAPSPELAAPLAACLAARPDNTTPPPPPAP